MKTYTFILIALFLSLNILAATPSFVPAIDPTATGNPKLTKEEFRILQMKAFANITAGDYQKLTGKKMNFIQRAEFRLSQKRAKTMLKQYEKGDVSVFQKIGWLCKGILLGPIALLLGYLLFKNEERELIKWIWFGFAGWVVWVTLVLLIV